MSVFGYVRVSVCVRVWVWVCVCVRLCPGLCLCPGLLGLCPGPGLGLCLGLGLEEYVTQQPVMDSSTRGDGMVCDVKKFEWNPVFFVV